MHKPASPRKSGWVQIDRPRVVCATCRAEVTATTSHPYIIGAEGREYACYRPRAHMRPGTTMRCAGDYTTPMPYARGPG